MPESTRAGNKYRKRRINLKRQGKCMMCAKRQARPDHTRCEECAAWHVSYTIQRRKLFAASGLCCRCGRARPLESTKGRNDSLCEECYLRKTARKSLGSEKHWGAIREKLLAQRFRCAYTGTLLQLGVNDSVDHMLPSSRFPELKSSPDNIEWVTRSINNMKLALTSEEFMSLTESILQYRQVREVKA